MSSILTVSQINTYLKSILDSDYNIKKIYISGEVSNFKTHYISGHCYFTLKDDKSVLKAVMFATCASKLKFKVEDGMQVVARGRVSIYERDGSYQLYVDELIPEGIGELTLAYDQLKLKLADMGMFDESRKKPLPKFPQKIGIITSKSGAAIEDICSIIQRRFPSAEIILEPVQVQGEGAALQISKAIDKFNTLNSADVLIIGRGGGSIEDLWAFNEEIVAHSIFSSEIPIISAVGHETDYTISDFVSDLRASTPSAAAELVVPEKTEALYSVDRLLDSLNDSINDKIARYELDLNTFDKYIQSKNPNNVLALYQVCLNEFSQSIENSINKKVTSFENNLSGEIIKLEYTNPLKALSRGFTLVTDENENSIKIAKNLKENEKINVRFADAIVNCTVNNVDLI